ncbi:MAG TPA: DNA internalization-related competence protein ComEC/Rec2 [Planctomycetaceae bacterium]|nr:DNA internalization-related competence protein ComEC/Rec2 [Planctomycetaceae bacterium]
MTTDQDSTTVPSSPPRARAYQPLLIVLGAVCLGIFLDRRAAPSPGVWWGLAAAGWSTWLVAWQLRRSRIAGVALLLAIVAAAGVWHHLRWSLFTADDIGRFVQEPAEPVCVEALVEQAGRRLAAPEYDPMRIIPQGDRTQFELRLQKIRDGSVWRSASGRATLLVDGQMPDIRAGDRLRVFGKLAGARVECNPGQFDRAEYLRADRVRATLRAGHRECVVVVERAGDGAAGWWLPRQSLDRARQAARSALWQRLEPRQAALASALLLGNREDLDPVRSLAFQVTGTIHLLAISGLHVGIIALAIGFLLRLLRVPRGQAAVLIALAAVAYTLLTDAQPPAIRASVLVVVFSSAVVLGRRPLQFHSLAVAALVVLILNPADLFRTGPQLSFLAVAALMWFGPIAFRWENGDETSRSLHRLIDENRPWHEQIAFWLWRFFRGLTLISLIVSFVGMPLVMARFHIVTPVAIPLNVLLWIPVTVALSSGFVVFTVGWLIPPVGAVAGWICNASLAFINGAIDAAQRIPHGHSWVTGPAEWWLWGFYGGLAVAAVAWRRLSRRGRRWLAVPLVAWIAVGLLVGARPPRGDRLECTFLSVGHGLSVVLVLPDGRTVLYDAGSFGTPDSTAQVIASCLWHKGIGRLDALVLSHADADHYNAVPGLLRRVSVGAVYVPPDMFARENRSLRALREAIDTAGVPLHELAAGDFLGDRSDGGHGSDRPHERDFRIEVLHPVRQSTPASDNAGSLVLLVEGFGRRILLTGDLESPGLDELLAKRPVDCDVLLVPHHGSRQSNPPGLIDVCRPETAVISGSLSRNPAAIEQAYRSAGVRVLHTARVGAVEVVISPTGVDVEPYLSRSDGAELPK